MTDQSSTPVKQNLFFTVLGWLFGGFFVLTFIASLATAKSPSTSQPYSFILGLGFGIAGLLVLPPSLAFIRARFAFLNKSFAPPLAAFGAVLVFSAVASGVDPQPIVAAKDGEVSVSKDKSPTKSASIASPEVRERTNAKSAPEKAAAPPSSRSASPSLTREGTDEVEDVRLTNVQRNAVRSATNYLNMTGFSRKGLIDQLSSSYGEGFEVADATVAVDSMVVNWNENAARSAKQYLNMSGFSCQGLIEQLSSSAGDKYTKSQATYGARQAGAC
jgi:Host cell surface-exposed lipoprotein